MDRKDVTVTTMEGYSAILKPYKDRWKSIVHDNTFPGFTRSFASDVKFAPGCKLDQVLKNDVSWQRRNIQLLFNNNDEPIVYIGKLGLSGGGPLNFFGYDSCVLFNCYENVFKCQCGYTCFSRYCYSHCVYTDEHKCSKCRYSKCPKYYKCDTCSSSSYCSNCCGCYERRQAELARNAREQQERDRSRQKQERERQEQIRQAQVRAAAERQEEIRQQQEREEATAKQQKERERQMVLSVINRCVVSFKEEKLAEVSEDESESEIQLNSTKYIQQKGNDVLVHDVILDSILKDEGKACFFNNVSKSSQNPLNNHDMPYDWLEVSDDNELSNCVTDSVKTPKKEIQINNTIDIQQKSNSMKGTMLYEGISKHVFDNNPSQSSSHIPFAVHEKQSLSKLQLSPSVLRYVENGGKLYNNITKEYPESDWVYQSLLKSVVAFPHETIDSFLVERFRKSWSEVVQKYKRDKQEILLYALDQKKINHSLSLLKIDDLLDLVLETGTEGYEILCSDRKDWMYKLKMLWITPHVKILSFSEEAQAMLCAALAELPWSTLVIQQFLKVVQEEKAIAPIIEFLSVVRDKEVSDSLVLTTIWMTNTLGSPDSNSIQWMRTLSYQLLYNTIYQRSPQLAITLNGSLSNIVASTCSADVLEKFVTDHIYLLNQHPSDFAKVLDQLYNYQTTEKICTAAFQRIIITPVTDWPSTIDQLIVDNIFETSHEYTILELISIIAEKSPNVSFVQIENLSNHYQSVLQASHAPSHAFAMERVHSDNGTTITNFDKFFSENNTFHISVGRLNKLKRKPICEWSKKEVQLWSAYIKPTAQAKLSATIQSELIAVVQRAVELHHGFSPRGTQLLSLLTLLNTVDGGRLAQINTGEGKSLIVVMLAAIHALEGKQVDVITTSTELSIREVETQRPFFELLSLTVGENSQNSHNKSLVYKNDILYGIAGDFQGDILRTEFLGKDCRGDRKFQIVIVDEVDSMLFDNRTHSVRLSEECPGMNHLVVILGVIWSYLHEIARYLIDYDGKVFFMSDDFEVDGKEIKLSSGEPWESCATPITDKRSFITERARDHLEQLLRELSEEEKSEYQDYNNVNSRIQSLSEDLSKITNEEEMKTKELANATIYETELYNRIQIQFSCVPVSILLSQNIQRIKRNELEKISEEKKEILEKCKKLTDSQKEMKWSKRYPIIDVPVHLRSFTRSQIPYWIKNALNAAYAYKKDAHYAVVNDKIVPVNYNETGVFQSNMVWSDGLTQFLQLKEGLSIDPEGTATNFISNVSFFKRYRKEIYGLTGTLGEQSTNEFLHEMYDTDMVVIPPYKQQTIINNDHTPYLCKELSPIVVSDQSKWYKSIINQSLYHATHKRAVLIICKYINQVVYLSNELIKQHRHDKVFKYTGQETSFNKSNIDAGEIIVATNIAGRGTDFKTSDEVETHGGLYVAVTFLPKSYRVEMQNVGRTGREGKKGMAQLIVYDTTCSDMQVMKYLRNKQETTATSNAIDDAKKVLVQDALFFYFCNLENSYLPGVSECEKLQCWKLLLSDWNNYADKKLAPQKLKTKSKKWIDDIKKERIETAMGSLSAAEKNSLTSNDLKKVHEQIAQQVELERSAYEERYKTNVLDNFCASQPDHISKEMRDCLRYGQIFEQKNCSELAQLYNWGEYERKGCEETWGIWLKKKHLEDREICTETAIQEFDVEFVSTFKNEAKNDDFTHNPFFYILKGNDFLLLTDLPSAISCYDRAIKMDPTFSVAARYNKAHALLLYKENAGEKQETALTELKKAKELLNGIYKPALMTFNTLITQTGCKIKSSQHVQHQLDLLSEQENYILQSLKMIKIAQENKNSVKLSSKTLKEVFCASNGGHNKAIREAAVNGFTNLFTIEETLPIPWSSILTVAFIGIAQIAVGCMIVACTGGSLGVGFIKEGISDLIVSIQSAIKGTFSWAAWAVQKVISLAISIISAGYGAMKSGLKDAANTAKDLVGKTAVGAVKEGWTLAAKQVGLELGKDVLKTIMLEAGQVCTNKLFMEGLESTIKEKVETAITKALLKNPVVVNALKEDTKNGNTYFQQLFIKIGLEILQEKQEHTWIYMVREIANGVAINTIPFYGKVLQVAGVVDMINELTCYTDKFINQFNAKVEAHKNEMISDEVSEATNISNNQTNISNNQTTNSQETVISSTPLDEELREDDVGIHVSEEGTSYRPQTDTEATQLKGTYNHLGPSTPESLADHFKAQIVNKLTGSIKNNLINPLISYGVNELNSSIFGQFDKSVEMHRNQVKAERGARSHSNDLANRAKQNSRKTTEENQGKENTCSKEEKEPLNKCAQEAIQRIKNNDVKDGTDFGLISAIAEAPVYIYENEKLIYVVGDNHPGDPITLKHTGPTPDNPSGHFEPVDKSLKVEPTGKTNCGIDSVWAQLNETQRGRLKDVNGLRNAMIETIQNNEGKANQAYQSRDELAKIAPDRIIYGGQIIQFESDSSTMDEAESGEYQNHHILHKKLKDHPAIKKSGININSKANIVSLPTKKGKEVLETNRSQHEGRHSNLARAEIEQKLYHIESTGIEKKWDTKQYNDAVRNLMKELRRNLRSGSTDLYRKS